jgi:hypothetical protein
MEKKCLTRPDKNETVWQVNRAAKILLVMLHAYPNALPTGSKSKGVRPWHEY